MSATTPPPSPSPPVEPDQVHLSLPPSVLPEFKTPERRRSGSRPVPNITPLSRGSSMCQRQEGDTDRIEGYGREDYEEYIREDLQSRIFVDFEVFMKSVLHAPDDWKTRWGPTIEAVKTNETFEEHHKKYIECCARSGSPEKTFYGPLMNTANAVLDVLSGSGLDGISPKNSHYYHINDPKRLRGGVINKANLSPDLVVLHTDCRLSAGEGGLHWANPLHILEVKPHGSALCDGKNMPRLVVDGIDPISNHAPPPRRYGSSMSSPFPTATTTSGLTSASSNSKKRPADGSHQIGQQAMKKSKTKSASPQVPGSSASVGAGSNSTPGPETQCQVDPAVQVCRYLLEMFSVPLLRSHATVGLVDRGRLQLYHANHSVILVSSAIDFLQGEGVDMFIANIIAFRCLSLKQNGVLDALVPGNTGLVKNSNIPPENKVVQEGNHLNFPGNGSQAQFSVTLGGVISRDPAAIGRSTTVLDATSDRWPNTELVVKISWPGSCRVPETDFLKKANEEAEKSGGGWATKHLPQVFYAKDVVFDEGSTLESVARLFESAELVNGKHVYERRTLRIIVQERLYPLKSLGNVSDIGQVFLDVACIHRWLYDHPGILHRDLSLNNIMCRFIKEMNAEGELEQKVYGVLTDYDLSSWKKDLETDYTRTSQQRTGTPPYMALELLRGTNAAHLYRHDVESLFYIMLMMGGRHTINCTGGGTDRGAGQGVVMRVGDRPYEDWFNAQSYAILGSLKGTFFLEMPDIELSKPFEDFRPWLWNLQVKFSEGFSLRSIYMRRKRVQQVSGNSAGTVTTFDDETLGGCVDYSSIIEPTSQLTGELKGLIIRYDPTSPPPPTARSAV